MAFESLNPVTTTLASETDPKASKIRFKSASTCAAAFLKATEFRSVRSAEYGIFDGIEPETATCASVVSSGALVIKGFKVVISYGLKVDVIADVLCKINVVGLEAGF